jgi:hypothetical protein
LTDTHTSSPARPSAVQAASARSALRVTYSPREPIRPVFSAIEMKSAGSSGARSDGQRASASRPAIRPLSRSTIGW